MDRLVRWFFILNLGIQLHLCSIYVRCHKSLSKISKPLLEIDTGQDLPVKCQDAEESANAVMARQEPLLDLMEGDTLCMNGMKTNGNLREALQVVTPRKR